MCERKPCELKQIHPQIHKKMLKETGSYLALPSPQPVHSLLHLFCDTSHELVVSELSLKEAGFWNQKDPVNTGNSTTFSL